MSEDTPTYGETVEQEIQRKGLTAPRITPADIEANITSEYYFTGAEAMYGVDVLSGGLMPRGPDAVALLTFCVLVLRNGFTVHGVSACASPENFDAALGRRIARQNAVNAIWPLMGYALREKLSQVDER
jgi:hypothetical protein